MICSCWAWWCLEEFKPKTKLTITSAASGTFLWIPQCELRPVSPLAGLVTVSLKLCSKPILSLSILILGLGPFNGSYSVDWVQLLLVLGLGSLTYWYRACWGQPQLVCGFNLWEILGQSATWTEAGPLYGQATESSLGWVVSENYQGGKNSVSQVNGEQRFGACQCLLAGWVEGSTKEQWHLSPLPSTERAALTPAPLSLTQNLVASVHPHLFLVLFKLLLQSWSQKQVSLWVSESMYGSLKRKFWDSSSPLSHLNVISIVFHRQML